MAAAGEGERRRERRRVVLRRRGEGFGFDNILGRFSGVGLDGGGEWRWPIWSR